MSFLAFPMRIVALAVGLLVSVAAAPAGAQTAFFDLDGPDISASVTRGDSTLALSKVPALAVGDRLRIRADLPAAQSERYLLVVAFLRGATNPPPNEWFHRARTWRPGQDELEIVVPRGAEQAVLFLAPNTGGGFEAIRDAVRGRPGIFVRAARDLGQASLDRSRLDAFVTGVQQIGDREPDRIQAVSTALARSLAVQFDASCVRRQARSQIACLTQSRDSITLYNSRGTSLAETLTGAPADLAHRVSATAAGGAGAYSPYISVVRDVGRLLGAFQTAEYQYIPALTVARDDRTGLLLNTAPSFDAPQSVMVAALPPISAAPLPPPRLVPPALPPCATTDSLVIPVDDAPLLYSTGIARDVTLDVQADGGRALSVPMIADASRGGLVSAPGADLSSLAGRGQAHVRGWWGFERIASPAFRIVRPDAGGWRRSDERPLAPGREERLVLAGGAGACVASVALRDARGVEQPVEWSLRDGELDVNVPASATEMALMVRERGSTEPTVIALPRAATDRPAVTLIGRSTVPANGAGQAIALTSDSALPADAQLTFSVAAAARDRFRADDVIEVMAATGARIARLTSGEGYRLQDPAVAVATLRPSRDLGASAFGALRFRLVRGDLSSAWQPLGTLVRLPAVRSVACEPEPAGGCLLSGTDLFLIAAVASEPAFGDAVEVPSGFTGGSIRVPRPAAGELHLRLRDAPDLTGTIRVDSTDR